MSSHRVISTRVFDRISMVILIAVPVAFIDLIFSNFDEIKAVLIVTSVISVALIASSTIFDVNNGRNILLNGKAFFLFGFFVFMVVGMLKNVWIYDFPVVSDLSTILKASASVFFALVAFLLAYYLPSLTRKRKSAVTNSLAASGNLEIGVKNRLYFFACLTFILGVFGLALYNPLSSSSAVEESGSVSRFFVYFSITSGILCFYLWMQPRARANSKWGTLFLLIMLLINIGLSVFRASRYVNMYLYIFMLIYYFYHRQYVLGLALRLKHKIYIGLVVALLFLLGSLTKTLMLIGWQLDLIFEASNTQALNSRMLTMDFVDAFDNLCYIIEFYTNNDKYFLGWSLLSPFVNPIPRELWEAKPVAFGGLIARDLYPEMEGLSLAPSLVGELIANGGYLIMIMGFFIAGRLIKYCDELIQQSVRQSWKMIWLIPLLFLLAMENRGDFLINTEFFYIVMQLYIILRLSKLHVKVY